jgi:hypothetical protein
VERGSRADKAGLRAGDVVIRVGDQPVHDTSDFTHALHSHSGGPVSVAVIRDKKEQILTLTLPDRKDSGEIFEESQDAPMLDAETQEELSEVQNEIAKLQPQLELAEQWAERESKKTAEAHASLCMRQRQMKIEADRLKQQIEPQLREELEKSKQKLQQQMERLRHQMQGEWVEI